MGAQQAIRTVDVAESEGGLTRHLLTVDEFLLLHEAGAFAGLGRVQLIEGEIYIMNAVHRPHAFAQIEMLTAMNPAVRALRTDLKTYAPVSTRLDDHNLPQPDVVVATVEDDPLVSNTSIRLAVEVSSSTLKMDLRLKARLYARTGVPEYWVVDVAGRKIIRMTDADGEMYKTQDEFPFGAMIPLATIPDLVIDTAALA